MMLFFSMLAVRAETAPAQLTYLSPQIFPATDRVFGLEYRMSISAFENLASVNHELALATSDHGFSHEGFFVVEDPTAFETYAIFFALDIPDYRDADTDGIHDFYDRDVAVEGVVTQGLHGDGFGSARQFTATWHREAGRDSGSVVIDLPFFGWRFDHPMSLLSFDGTFDFVRNGTNLIGTIALTNTAMETETITGGLSLAIRDATNGVLQIRGTPGAWNGPSGFAYTYEATDLVERVSTNNARSFLLFEDGQPATAEPDYLEAVFVLKSGDANANGILDLVESLAPRPQPSLRIERVGEGVRLTIYGEPNGRYDLESAARIDAPEWALEQSVALGGSETTITKPALGLAKYYRLRER